MRGVSAWLIALRPKYGDLAMRDPVAFAASGVEIPDPTIRSAVIEGLIDSARESRTWSLRGSDYRSLRYPGLADQLAPVLANHDDEPEARYLAIQLAEFTGQQLLTELRWLARDPAEPDYLRSVAVAVIARVGDEASRTALGGLATEPGDDPRDDVKGAALEASFRHGLDLHDALEALTPPKVSNCGGLGWRPARSRRGNPEEVQVQGQVADGLTGQNPAGAATGAAARRRAAAQRRRGTHQGGQEHRRRRTVRRRRPGVPALPAGRLRPGLRRRPGHRQQAGPHPRGGGRVLVMGDRGSVASHRHPHRGDARAHPPQLRRLHPAHHR